MRRPIVAGNWKLHGSRAENARLVEDIMAQLPAKPAGQGAPVCIVCPPLVYLQEVGRLIRGSSIELGAQDVCAESQGAFTGEVSAAMLLDVGCKYVILGHSERRHILGETDADVNHKTLATLSAGLVPIVCVGELLAEREAGQTAAMIRRQFEGSLANVPADAIERIVIAYEPVWAIGTGKVATPQQAQEVHADLRRLLRERYNERSARVRVLYGGSVKPGNAAELLSQPDIDGALVGGASLKVDDFLGIASDAAKK